MDKHYLKPLFAPQSIVVFAGKADDPATQTSQAKLLHDALVAQRYSGRLAFVDIHNTTGTLADLAQTGFDLAIIALPPQDLAAALEIDAVIDPAQTRPWIVQGIASAARRAQRPRRGFVDAW